MTGATLFHDATMLVYVLHIGGGTVGLFSGAIAAVARKGGRLHRTAGNVFFVSMLVMAAFAGYLAVVVPGQIANLFGGAFVFYLVVTAWLAAWRPAGSIGMPEKIAFAAILCFFLPFAVLTFQVATGYSFLFKDAAPIRGPEVVALYVMTFVIAIAAASDAKVVLAGGIRGPARLARHLWRMCVALTMATGSAFTNGLPRLLPGPMHVTGIYFVPMLLPLGLLLFWMIRVRLTGWFRRVAVAQMA
jgi:hypothetical protein